MEGAKPQHIPNEAEPLITVIVPVYNTEAYLERCLRSIADQSYRNIDILLMIDGEMEDDSENICRRFSETDARFRMIKLPHSGVAEVRNAGIANAKGEMIGFVDSDDWIETEMLQKMLHVMQEQGTDMALCAFYADAKQKRTVYGKYEVDSICSDDFLRLLFRGEAGNFLWNKLFKKEIYSGIVFPRNTTGGEDISVMPELISRCNRISLVNEPLYHYVRREGSIIDGRKYSISLDILESLIRQYAFVLDRRPEMEGDIVQAVYKGYVSLAASRVLRGKSREEKRIEQNRRINSYYYPKKDVFDRNLSGMKKLILHLIWRDSFFHSVLALSLELLRRILRKE